MGVSRRTMEAALAQLEADGMLLPAKARRGHFIHPGAKSAVENQSSQRLFVASSVPLQACDYVSREIVEGISGLLVRKGWEVDHVVNRALSAPKLERELERQADGLAPGMWLLLEPALPAVRWAVSSDLRAICLGGEAREQPILCAAVSLRDMAAAAVKELLAAGHRRIVVPIPPFSENAVATLTSVVAECFRAKGTPFSPAYNTPVLAERTPEALWECLRGVYSVTPPTAFVLMQIVELHLFQSYCLRRGLRIPEDVSVVLLDDDPRLSWVKPEPTRFRYPVRRFIRTVARWLENFPAKDRRGLTLLEPEFIKGGTIASPAD